MAARAEECYGFAEMHGEFAILFRRALNERPYIRAGKPYDKLQFIAQKILKKYLTMAIGYAKIPG